MPKAAVFDIGATLVTGPPVAPNKAIAEWLDNAEAADVASIIMTNEFVSADGVCKALAARYGALSAVARLAVKILWESQCTAAQALPGAAETVLSLKQKGLKIGLLSDIWSPYYASVEKALPEVVKCADSIVLSCRTGVRKPCLENFVRSLEALGVSACEAVMIGDTYSHDIEPALSLGMQAVWVLARPDREAGSVIKVQSGESPQPTAVVSGISEVASLSLW